MRTNLKRQKRVLVPKDYSKLQLPSDEAYIQYYNYWKSWQEELITSISYGESKKRITSCLDQAILNLGRMKDLLTNQEKIKLLDSYIQRMLEIRSELEVGNFTAVPLSSTRRKVEILLLDVKQKFSISKVRDSLR